MISGAIPGRIIILFDGVCNLCNSSVNFLIDHDRTDIFRFASLQSETGQRFLDAIFLEKEKTDSVVVIDKDRYYIKSSAIFRITDFLPFPFSLLKAGKILPVFISDRIYDFVAASRYSIFGKREVCRIPTPEIRAKFLD